jgi:hypothetical protein
MGVEKLDFDALLAPYRAGGTESEPVQRTIGTIASKLIFSNRMEPEVVGAAILKVFTQMLQGLEFKGNGTYGSKGRELYSCIKAQAVDLSQRKAEKDCMATIADELACCDMKCRKRIKAPKPPGKKWWKRK